MRDGFVLDPAIAYLNHGGYGACPRPVLEEYQRLQVELERGPTDFLGRRLASWSSEGDGGDGLLDSARAALAVFVRADASDLVFVPNATSALNMVIRSLELSPADEILTTAHEYGAIARTWQFVGARLVVCEPDELPARIGPQTRAVQVSHVTSPTALVLQVAEICAAAREAGAISIVDGAHAPGQLDLDLGAVGADVYAGNCHKWLCAPKGAGFLWVRQAHQDWIAPRVVSWGCHDDADFGERHGWAGTLDPAAYLSVPKAIEVHETFDLAGMRELADEAERRLDELGLPRVPGTPAPFMRAVELPAGDAPGLWRLLYEDFRIEVPVYEWEGRRLLRISVGPYNDEEDVDRLVDALRRSLWPAEAAARLPAARRRSPPSSPA